MIIPWESLGSETLDAVITEFVLREGTDYGEIEVPLAAKIAQIRHQLYDGQIVLLWSQHNESITLVPESQIKRIDVP